MFLLPILIENRPHIVVVVQHVADARDIVFVRHGAIGLAVLSVAFFNMLQGVAVDGVPVPRGVNAHRAFQVADSALRYRVQPHAGFLLVVRVFQAVPLVDKCEHAVIHTVPVFLNACLLFRRVLLRAGVDRRALCPRLALCRLSGDVLRQRHAVDSSNPHTGYYTAFSVTDTYCIE